MTDWTNPCDRAAALRAAYYALISGTSAVRVSVKAGDTVQETEFQRTDQATLLSQLRMAEAECAALTPGATPARFAIRAGYRT